MELLRLPGTAQRRGGSHRLAMDLRADQCMSRPAWSRSQCRTLQAWEWQFVSR